VFHVEVEAPERLPALPAAVEVATYRIATEALANVSRHANATHCWIRLRIADDLVVTIEDDGRGIPRGRSRGVGLRSMRERATELGGSFSIVGRPGSGTIVTARLPLDATTPESKTVSATAGSSL
jgi:signal transduction histidine kinase